MRHATWLLIVLIAGITLRLYNIQIPLLDAKPHREIHTAEETRNLYYDQELLYPKVKLWADEPGYYLAEFPLYNSVVSSLYQINGGVDETLGRLVSVISSVGVALFFYLFVRRHFDSLVALWATTFFYLISPQEIILSRSFQPDQFGLFFGMASLYTFSLWIDKKKVRYFTLSFIAYAVTLLVKIQFFPFAFPMIYLVFKKWGRKVFTNGYLYIYTLSSLPVLLWIAHLKSVYSRFPQLHSGVLLNPLGWLQFEKLLDVHWHVNLYYDFIDQIVTAPVLLLALFAFLIKKKQHYGLIFSWLFGLMMFGLLFIGKIHFWYYQVPFMFPFAIFAAIGLSDFYSHLKKHITVSPFLIVFLVLVLMYATGRPYLLRTYTISSNHRSVLDVSEKVRRLTPTNSKVLLSSYTNAALTYYSLRPDLWGGTLQINDFGCSAQCTIEKLESFRDWGATLYAISDKNEFEENPQFELYLRENYEIIFESNNSIIFDIKSHKEPVLHF